MDQEFEDQEFEDQEFEDQEFEEPQSLNPWFSIWLQPRATMQQILDTDPARLVLMLAIIAGFFEALDQAVIQDLGDRMASWQSVVFAAPSAVRYRECLVCSWAVICCEKRAVGSAAVLA